VVGGREDWGGGESEILLVIGQNNLDRKRGTYQLVSVPGFASMYISFLDAGIGFICGSATCPKITSNTFHCILMSIGLFIEDARGLVNQNIFREVQLL